MTFILSVIIVPFRSIRTKVRIFIFQEIPKKIRKYLKHSNPVLEIFRWDRGRVN